MFTVASVLFVVAAGVIITGLETVELFIEMMILVELEELLTVGTRVPLFESSYPKTLGVSVENTSRRLRKRRRRVEPVVKPWSNSRSSVVSIDLTL